MRAILLVSLVIPSISAAAGTELVCPLVGGGLIQIDGLLDDWPAMREVTKAGSSPHDAGLALRCAYDDAKLYLAVNVTDERLVRARSGPQDRLVLDLGEAQLAVEPSAGHLPLATRWIERPGAPGAARCAGGKAAARRCRQTHKRALPVTADSLQPHGWSVELALPLAQVPGWSPGAPSLSLSVKHEDVDQRAHPRVEETVATGPVKLTFEAAARTLRAFLDDQKLRASDVRLDTVADMDGEPGVERVIVAGRVLAVLSDGYTYLTLPVAGPRDLLDAQVVDLEGGGHASVVVRYREHGNGGSRDVLAIWQLRGGGFARAFAHEIAKQVGSARLTDHWELVPRKDGKGRDLVITPGEVTGFTAATWNETPASDMVPILLPWGERKQEVWHFQDGQVSGG